MQAPWGTLLIRFTKEMQSHSMNQHDSYYDSVQKFKNTTLFPEHLNNSVVIFTRSIDRDRVAIAKTILAWYYFWSRKQPYFSQRDPTFRQKSCLYKLTITDSIQFLISRSLYITSPQPTPSLPFFNFHDCEALFRSAYFIRHRNLHPRATLSMWGNLVLRAYCLIFYAYLVVTKKDKKRWG